MLYSAWISVYLYEKRVQFQSISNEPHPFELLCIICAQMQTGLMKTFKMVMDLVVATKASFYLCGSVLFVISMDFKTNATLVNNIPSFISLCLCKASNWTLALILWWNEFIKYCYLPWRRSIVVLILNNAKIIFRISINLLEIVVLSNMNFHWGKKRKCQLTFLHEFYQKLHGNGCFHSHFSTNIPFILAKWEFKCSHLNSKAWQLSTQLSADKVQLLLLWIIIQVSNQNLVCLYHNESTCEGTWDLKCFVGPFMLNLSVYLMVMDSHGVVTHCFVTNSDSFIHISTSVKMYACDCIQSIELEFFKYITLKYCTMAIHAYLFTRANVLWVSSSLDLMVIHASCVCFYAYFEMAKPTSHDQCEHRMWSADLSKVCHA